MVGGSGWRERERESLRAWDTARGDLSSSQILILIGTI